MPLHQRKEEIVTFKMSQCHKIGELSLIFPHLTHPSGEWQDMIQKPHILGPGGSLFLD